jgi:DNA-directed RNA polymerase sigma subunit (sigma70/sigma32)
MRNEKQRKDQRNRLLVEYKDTNDVSFQKVAEIFSISRQRVHQIYWNEKRQKNG